MMFGGSTPDPMTPLPALRIAVTGTPGCGKTSMCEAGRIHLQEQGEEIAVQTVKELADAAGALGAGTLRMGPHPSMSNC